MSAAFACISVCVGARGCTSECFVAIKCFVENKNADAVVQEKQSLFLHLSIFKLLFEFNFFVSQEHAFSAQCFSLLRQGFRFGTK